MSIVNRYNTTELFYNLNDSVAELNGLENEIVQTNIYDDNELRHLIRQLIIPQYRKFNKESKKKILLSLRYCILKLTNEELFKTYDSILPLLYIPIEYDIRHFFELTFNELGESLEISDDEISHMQDVADNTEALSMM